MKSLNFCTLLLSLWISVGAGAAPVAPSSSPKSKDQPQKDTRQFVSPDNLPKGKDAPRETKSAITQIRLITADGLMVNDEIVFRQDGTATRITGERLAEKDKATHLAGQIPTLQFKRLVVLIDSIDFYSLKKIYTSYDWTPSYFVEVSQGNEKKSIAVRDGNVFGGGHTPIGLWGLNMAIRGIAGDIKWEKVEDKADAKSGNKNNPQ